LCERDVRGGARLLPRHQLRRERAGSRQKALPWSVPDFSVARYEPVLCELQLRLERRGTLRFRAGRFLIVARKDALW